MKKGLRMKKGFSREYIITHYKYIAKRMRRSKSSKEVHWENVKKSLSEAEVEDHPARFALVEVVNVHDDGIVFEPIHRVLFNIEPESVLNALQDFFGSSCCSLEKFDSLESVNKDFQS